MYEDISVYWWFIYHLYWWTLRRGSSIRWCPRNKKEERDCHNMRFYWRGFIDAVGNLRQQTNQLTDSVTAEPKGSTPKSASRHNHGHLVFITCFPSISMLLSNLLGFPWGCFPERFHHQNSACIPRLPHVSHISSLSCISRFRYRNNTR